MSKSKMVNLLHSPQRRRISNVNKTFRLSLFSLQRTHNFWLEMISVSQQSERRNIMAKSRISANCIHKVCVDRACKQNNSKNDSNLLLDECNCLARIQTFRTGLRTIHDRMATVQLEGVIKRCDIRVRAINDDLKFWI